jgi:hypothetical protein
VFSALGVFSTLLLVGCLTPTPFGTDVDEQDLNRRNLEWLQAEPRAGPLSFVALGDTHDEYDDLVTTIEILNAHRDLDFLVHTGDLTDRGLLREFEWVERALSKSRIPVFVTIGNHDAISSGKEIYRKLFGPFDYGFTFKNQKFIFFNSNAYEFPGSTPDRSWLVAQLAALSVPVRAILVTHQPARSPSEMPGENTAEFYAGLAESFPISLWITGHEQDFELRAFGQTLNLQTSTFQKTALHTIVHIDDRGRARFELCRFADCRSVSPAPEVVGPNVVNVRSGTEAPP